MREAAARLYPPIHDLDSLAGAAIPNLETLTRYRNDLTGVETELQHERDRLTTALAGAADAEAKLQDLTSVRPVASAEVIAVKRQERDSVWNALRATLFGSSEALRPGQLADLVTRFERYSLEADRMADQAVNDADRIAAHAIHSARLKDERSKQAGAEARIAALEKRREGVVEGWVAAWEATGIMPLHPAEMTAWCAALAGLLERREKLVSERNKLAAIKATIQKIEPEVRVLAAQVGLHDANGLDLEVVCSGIENRLRTLTDAWDRSRDLETRVRDGQRRIEELIAARTEAESSMEEWSARWSAAVTSIGLRFAATIEEAQAALDVWNEVPNAIRERNNRARRVSGMQRDVDAFESEVKDVAGAIAPDLATLPADAAVKLLNDRVTDARAAESRKTEAHRRLVEANRAREDADTALKDAEASLAALSAELPLGCDLTELLNRLRERDRLVASLGERRMNLITQGEGHDEPHLRAELVNFNADDVESKLQILSEEEQLLEREAQEVFAAREQAFRERNAAEQGMGAELAAQQRASAEAELIETSREWAVLRLGALLLSTLIDRRRTLQK